MKTGMRAEDKVTILGAGFIGRNLLRSYCAEQRNLCVLDKEPCPDECAQKVNWIRGTFTAEADVTAAVKGASIVYHLISSTVPGDEIDESEELFGNVIQTIKLLKICVREKVKRVVFTSSASVYGPQAILPIPETACTNPISSHGIHKLTIEKYMLYYKYKYGLDCKIVRLSNPYGMGQDVYGRQGFVAIAMGKLLLKQTLVIRGDGSAKRDFIHIDDVVDAINLIGETKSDEVLFNVGSGRAVKLIDVLHLIGELSGHEIMVKYSTCRTGDIVESALDVSRAHKVLGFKPKVTLRDGLALLLGQHGLIC